MRDEPEGDRRGAVAVTVAAAAVAWIVGGVVAAALMMRFTVVQDPCPGYDDEGTMAAPGSPYARLMCDGKQLALAPDEVLTVPAVLVLAGALGLLAAVVALALARRHHRPGSHRRRSVAGWLLAALVAPVVVVLLAQLALPRDCLSGRTTTGACSRDREMR